MINKIIQHAHVIKRFMCNGHFYAFSISNSPSLRCLSSVSDCCLTATNMNKSVSCLNCREILSVVALVFDVVVCTWSSSDILIIRKVFVVSLLTAASEGL